MTPGNVIAWTAAIAGVLVFIVLPILALVVA